MGGLWKKVSILAMGLGLALALSLAPLSHMPPAAAADPAAKPGAEKKEDTVTIPYPSGADIEFYADYVTYRKELPEVKPTTSIYLRLYIFNLPKHKRMASRKIAVEAGWDEEFIRLFDEAIKWRANIGKLGKTEAYRQSKIFLVSDNEDTRSLGLLLEWLAIKWGSKPAKYDRAQEYLANRSAARVSFFCVNWPGTVICRL